ncbi:MAG: DUF1275 domain-containing protein [Oscillospiraceae bacterium]|nr:DUF1275 domain-containing protein [Oscillospiraceae bacterium]
MDAAMRREDAVFLTCEKYRIFELLIFAAGMMGAYTFNLRGGVFCNAQTANVVLMALEFGHFNWAGGFYYLIPISAYLSGTIISEVLPGGIRDRHFLRWDTYLIVIEMAVLFGIGFIPLSAPVQIVQVTINFICSMQYNTFRQAEGIPMATTFVTNHIRQTGIWLVKGLRKHDGGALRRSARHLGMVAVFFLGGLVLTLLCPVLGAKSIWLALVPLGVILIVLLRADLVAEKQLFDRKPRGH